MGNLTSVQKAFKRIGSEAKISSDPAEILNAEKLVLPGVGHFKSGMEHLRERRLIEPLNKKVLEEGTPIIGICLGMQLMTRYSEEGNAEGLGWFDANTIRFNLTGNTHNLRVPHMGWNTLQFNGEDPMLRGIDMSAKFYFVHSYHVICRNSEDVFATTGYDITFTSAIHKGSIYGFQFHPEKSHENGLRLLKNFAAGKRAPVAITTE